MLDKYVHERTLCTITIRTELTVLCRVEDALEIANIRYDRLDGTMKRDDRTKAMEALKNDPACEVLLVSLKAGGVGLNLTAASRVYLMDPYWSVRRITSLLILLLTQMCAWQESCGGEPSRGPYCTLTVQEHMLSFADTYPSASAWPNAPSHHRETHH